MPTVSAREDPCACTSSHTPRSGSSGWAFHQRGTDSLAHHNRNRKLATGTMSICIFTHSPSQDQRKRIEDEFSLCRRGKLVSTCPRHNINILGTDSDLSAPSPNTWAVMQNEPPKRLWRIA